MSRPKIYTWTRLLRGRLALVDVEARLPVVVQPEASRAHTERLAVARVAVVAAASVVVLAEVDLGARQPVL